MRTTTPQRIRLIPISAGMVMIVAIGWLGFGQRLDQPALLGVGLILAGVMVLNLFSGSLGH